MATRRSRSPLVVESGSITLGEILPLTPDQIREGGYGLPPLETEAANDEGAPGLFSLRGAGDSALALGRGLATGVRGMTDIAGTDNPVSEAIGQGVDFLDRLESPERRAERQRRAQIIKEAEESGSITREIGAYLGSFAEAPLDTLLEAVGTTAPTLLALFLPGGQAAAGARIAASTGIGAAQGAGFTKRSIADSTEQALIESGVAPDEARARAVEAQSWGGPNADQIFVGGGVGAVAGRFGAEGTVARSLSRVPMVGSRAGHALAAAGGEFVTEAAQGGHEQFAGNLAQQREGLDTPLMQGVAGSSALEGVAGAGVGAGFGLVAGSPDAVADGEGAGVRAPSVGEMLAQAGAPQGAPQEPVSPGAALAAAGEGSPGGRPLPIRTSIEEFSERELANAREMADDSLAQTGEHHVVEIRGGTLAVVPASRARSGTVSHYSTASADSAPATPPTDERPPAPPDVQDPAEVGARRARLLEQLTELAKDPLVLKADRIEPQGDGDAAAPTWHFGAMGKTARGKRAAALLRKAQEAGIPEADIGAAIQAGNAATKPKSPRFDDPNAPAEPDSNALERARVRAQALADDQGGRWAVAAVGKPEDGRYEAVPMSRLKGRRPLFEVDGGKRRRAPTATPAGRMPPGATRGRSPIVERHHWESAEEGETFLRGQRRAGQSTLGAQMRQDPAGGFVSVFPDEPEFNDPAWQVQATPTPARTPQARPSPGQGVDAASEMPARGTGAQGQTSTTGPAISSTPVADTPDTRGVNQGSGSPDTGTVSTDAIAPGGLSTEERNDPDVRAYIRAAARAQREEKQSDPANWTPEQREAYGRGDWREFSRLRGYTDSEIENFGEFMRLASTLNDRYGDGFAQDLSFGISRGLVSVEDEAAAPASSPASAANDEAPAPAAAQASRRPVVATKIDDFGEKLAGARKDAWTDLREKLQKASSLEIAAEPLSKSWPAPDYQALLDAGADPWAVAFMHAARDAIPAKPKMPAKLKRWAEMVRLLREVSMGLADGTIDQANAQAVVDRQAFSSRDIREITGRIQLYETVGHSKSLAGVRISMGTYSLYEGVEHNPPKEIWTVEKQAAATAFSNWPRVLASGDTLDAALADFKRRFDALEINPPASKETSFEIFSKRGEKGYWVGKKIGRNPLLLEGPFDTLQEARAYKASHNAELTAKLEKSKEVPRERRDTNEPRVGEDTRGGVDVTPEMFQEAFGFRGVQFGNYVEQGRRQKDLNDAYDALMDMAAVLGIDPKAISLNGELGLAFGARGKGGKNPAAAHYEPGHVVINLTKREGAGSLGHEWWHALDNYFSRMRGKGDRHMTSELDVNLASRGAKFFHEGAVRREMVVAFGEVMRAISSTAIKARANKLDAKRTKAYWTTEPEMSARAFESYLISKLQDQGASNDYLANIVDEKTWAAAESLGFEIEESYPYPTAGEVPAIRAGFDRFFETVQARETDRGVALFSRGATGPGMRVGPLRSEMNATRKAWGNAPPVQVVATVDDLPFQAPADAEGAFHDGHVWLVAENLPNARRANQVLLHEVIGHNGIIATLGRRLVPTMRAIYRSNAEVRAIADRWMADNGSQDQVRATEEAIAQLAERGEITQQPFWARLAAAIRNAIRALGFKVAWSDADIEALLAAASRQVRQVETGAPAPSTGESESVAGNRGPHRPAGANGRFAQRVRAVNGERPARFSRAQLNTDAFRRWFGDSKVVDENGEPLVVYHGTSANQDGDAFTMFDTYASNYGLMGQGGYFTADPSLASSYASKGRGTAPTVYPVYLAVKNPLDMDAKADAAAWRKAFPGVEDFHEGGDTNESWYRAAEESVREEGLPSYEGAEVMQDGIRSMGHDGITHMGGGRVTSDGVRHRVFIAFDPEQIKSAIGNAGTFDPASADIRFSRSPAQQLVQAGGPTPEGEKALGRGFTAMLMQNWQDSTRGGKTFRAWRGINTQYHKATLDADFKQVFDAAQDYSKDVSRYANRAADLAPTMLPNITAAKDILRKRRVKAEDMAKVADAVLEGTLVDADPAKGKAWTERELRTRFGMNDKQVGLYQEYRAAVVRSLDDFGRSELLRFADEHMDPLTRRQVMEVDNIQAGYAIMKRRLAEVNRDSTPEQRRELQELRRRLDARVDRIEALKENGYSPLMRFGRHAVWIRTQKSPGEFETHWFSLHDNVRDANRSAREMLAEIRREHPNAVLSQGVTSDEEHKLFSGVTADTLEVFGEEAGFSDSAEWKKLIELTKSNRSALKRMLERKRTPGFSRDMTRTLAAFVTSNGRATAGNIHAGELVRAARAIPDSKGDVKDEAVRLVRYLQDPVEEAQALRGLMFSWFLGGSVASAAVNLTQPLTMSLPYIAIKDGPAKATARILAAAKAVVSGKYKPDTARALKRAELEGGVVDPQEVHMLQAEVSRNLGASVRLRKALFAWGYMFAAAERFNRRVTFVAAYEQAKELGSLDPVSDAEKAVVETQGIYNRGNKANWARGAVGGTVMTFKQFSIAYVEFVARLLKNPETRPSGLLALGILIALSGLSGLPFMEDLDDVIDTIAQSAGYNFQSDAAKQEFLARIFGDQVAEFALYGMSSLPGMPIDVQQRLGLGNLIPGTAALKKSAGPRAGAREAVEVAGPAGSMVKDAGEALKALLEGEPGRAAKSFMPVAVANAAKGFDMITTGMYRDTRGRRVTDVEPVDALAKSIGFQPASVGRINRLERDVIGSNTIVRSTEAEIAGLWAAGVFEKDKAKQERARARLRAWNEKNPQTPIRITPTQIRQRVRQMALTRGERIVKTSPREVRAAAAAALRQQQE